MPDTSHSQSPASNAHTFFRTLFHETITCKTEDVKLTSGMPEHTCGTQKDAEIQKADLLRARTERSSAASLEAGLAADMQGMEPQTLPQGKVLY